ncbi:toprim domain-containing protein [Actinomadura rubrisoli]|uniref:Toprim domain-containing protein n=1 Tax=Actinomadura rubrisoli TaxID=2530368 RepID=A0A4R5AJF4_9ACTN|nr:toprim domain-containing protein [Actinomadura rubrisoli]TDD71114.1 toprim domain-containing protein [Actinomadura rubrisoli]
MTVSSEGEQTAQADDQGRRLDILQGIANHTVTRLADGRLRWDAWLEQASRHVRYGFTNTLLIPAQRPSATDVRSYDAWQKQGHQVRRGETGIRIISTRGKPRPVFDVEQTDGEPIEERLLTPAEGLGRLSQLAADLGLYIDRGQGWTYLGPPERRIRIAPELDEATAASMLAHQLAHAIRPGGHIDTVSTTSAPCHGVRRVLADSVAYLVLADLGLEVSHLSFPPPRQWAGTDSRTDTSAVIRAVGDQIVRTGARLQRRLRGGSVDAVSGTAGADKSTSPAMSASAGVAVERADRSLKSSRPVAPAVPEGQQPPDVSAPRLRAALADAHRFYLRNLPRSWGVRYLAGRGFSPVVQEQWEVGFAPRTGHALLRHLRELGHVDETLVSVGLVKRRDSGELFDLFRDRVLFPLRDKAGAIVGFIGRRRDQAPGPKYLNTPETPLFHKSEILFGLHESRAQLGRTARPLLVEGPLDAIAVNVTMPEEYAAVAPCGTAITPPQVEAIAAHTDLETAGLVIALDGDDAGRAGSIRAWRTLRSIAGPVEAAVLPRGQDPAELLSSAGHLPVREALLCVTGLADLVIDERIERFGGTLEFIESRVAAARAAAVVIAELPPDQIARQVARVAARTGMALADATAAVTSAISPDPPPDVSAAKGDTPRSPPLGPEQPNSCRIAASKRPDVHRRMA